MLRRTYLKNAVILTATGLILRAAGMFFRVYVARQIGTQGMGLYQLIGSVYTMAVTMASSGLCVAATRLCAGLLAVKNEAGAAFALKKTMRLGAAAGTGTALLMLLGADLIAVHWLGDCRAAPALRLLAPGLPFIALSACLRGYFMARRNVQPDARARLLEQCVRIGFTAAVIGRAVPAGIGASCAAVYAGNTVSEAASWLYMHISLKREHRRLHLPAAQPVAGLAGRLRTIITPIAAGQHLTGMLRTAENIMVPACLAVYTGSRETALGGYGALRGMAIPVIFFPFSFLSALSELLLPEITQARAQQKDRSLKMLIGRALCITAVLSVPAGGLFTLFSGELGMLLYRSREIGFYLRVLGPLMPLMYLESIVDGILKGLGEQMASFRYAVIDSGLRIVLIALLVPRYGMAGFLFVMIFSNLLTSLLNLNRLLRVSGMKMQWGQWAFKPAAAFLCAVLAYRFVFRPSVCGIGMHAVVRVCSGMIFTAAVYFTAALLTGCVQLKKISFFYKKGVDTERTL